MWHGYSKAQIDNQHKLSQHMNKNKIKVVIFNFFSKIHFFIIIIIWKKIDRLTDATWLNI